MKLRGANSNWLNIWALLALGIALRWIAFYYFYYVYVTPGGLPLPPTWSEAAPYEILARQFLGGSFEQELFSYRPPLQPMFIALIYTLGGTTNPLAAAFVQTILSAGIIPIAYAIAKELGAPRRVQLLAGLLIAVDPASIMIGLYLMAETLSNIFLAAALLFLVRALRHHRSRDAAASAACLALATLARPTSLYFFVPVAGLMIWLIPRWPQVIAVFLGVFIVGVFPWNLRNYVYHGSFTFSAVGNFDLLYYKGVQIEHWATGEDPLEIQTRLAYEADRRLGVAEAPETYDHLSMWRHLAPDPEVTRVVREMALEIFLSHPLVYILIAPITVARMLALTPWLDFLGIVRWLEIPYHLLFYGLAGLGLLPAWKRGDRIWLGANLATIAYFVAVPVVASGSGVDTRTRTIFTVCLAALAADGLNWLLKKRQLATTK